MKRRITWSNSDGFTSLPHIHLINLQIPKIRKIDETSVGYRSPSSVLLHARSRVPPSSEDVFTVGGIDDHAPTSLAGTSFDVVDGRCDGVDKDRRDPSRLKGK